MATLTQFNVGGTTVPVAATVTTLGASDTFVYSAGTGQILELTNGTGGTLTANIDGSAATTISPAGLGQTVDVSSGYNIALTAGQTKLVRLDAISVWLAGTIAMTGASGVTAKLFTV